MTWPGERQRHSLSARGIKTLNWRLPEHKDDIPDIIYVEQITDFTSFKSAQEILRENPTALIVDAKSPGGIDLLDGADGVMFKSSKFATYWTPDGTRFGRGSVRDHLNKFTKLTGEENMQLLLTTGRRAYTNAKLKNVLFQIAIPKDEYKEVMNKRYRKG